MTKRTLVFCADFVRTHWTALKVKKVTFAEVVADADAFADALERCLAENGGVAMMLALDGDPTRLARIAAHGVMGTILEPQHKPPHRGRPKKPTTEIIGKKS
jgi:hypothetical protein